MARARRAHDLLRTTSWPLADVAAAAGFGSERQLHETVRRIYGRAPSQIRELAARLDQMAPPVGAVAPADDPV